MAAPTLDRATDTLLDYIALGLLVAGPKHGYALYQDFAEMFAPVWQAGRSKFYATLAGLHDAGALDVELEPQENRPPRKVYRLTGQGQAAFEAWLREPVPQPRDVRVLIPVKLRFYETLDWPGAHGLLDAQIEVCRERLAFEAHRPESPEARDDDFFFDILYEFRRRQLMAMIDWLRTCKDRFARLAPPDSTPEKGKDRA